MILLKKLCRLFLLKHWLHLCPSANSNILANEAGCTALCSEMTSGGCLYSGLIFPWQGAPSLRFRWLQTLDLGSQQPGVTTSYDLTESAGICSDRFTFPGRCRWILTVQWPWAVLAVSTKQYVHTYHQPRHKSPSPQRTLNQVLVSGWEPRAAASQQGQKGRPNSEHNYRCQENQQVGKCKQKLKNVLIRLPPGGLGAAKS